MGYSLQLFPRRNYRFFRDINEFFNLKTCFTENNDANRISKYIKLNFQADA
jgi:hypothetical protein